MRYLPGSRQQAPHFDNEATNVHAEDGIMGTYYITRSHGTFYPTLPRGYMQQGRSSHRPTADAVLLDPSHFSSPMMEEGASSWARANTPHYGPQHNPPPPADGGIAPTRWIYWTLMTLGDPSDDHTHDIAEGPTSRGVRSMELFDADVNGQPIVRSSSPPSPLSSPPTPTPTPRPITRHILASVVSLIGIGHSGRSRPP